MQMKAIILLLTIGLICSQNLNRLEDIFSNFQKFIKQNKVAYQNDKEFNRLYSIYQENEVLVKNHDNTEYALEINKFATLTKAEFKARYCTLSVDSLRKLYDEATPENTTVVEDSAENVHLLAAPASWDWRNNGAVTGVKDQGQCGCCWAFSTLASLEGSYARKYKNKVQFSEQQLLSCDNSNNGCNGGNMQNAINYIKNAGGVARMSAIPYNGQKSGCSFKSSQAAARASGYTSIGQDENQIKEALYKYGPLAAAIDSSNLQFYSNGVYSCGGNSSPNHAITIVGYGSGSNGNYWIIKNSWGSSWGMNGYFYLKRGNNDCGIASYVVAAHAA